MTYAYLKALQEDAASGRKKRAITETPIPNPDNIQAKVNLKDEMKPNKLDRIQPSSWNSVLVLIDKY